MSVYYIHEALKGIGQVPFVSMAQAGRRAALRKEEFGDAIGWTTIVEFDEPHNFTAKERAEYVLATPTSEDINLW